MNMELQVNNLDDQKFALKKLAAERTEVHLWDCVVAFQNVPFRTASGLSFQYQLKVGRNGCYNKELLIDRRKESKSLAWSSILLAFRRAVENENGNFFADRPKALGDIRGVSYIYPLFYRFGMIEIPKKVKEKMEAEEAAIWL